MGDSETVGEAAMGAKVPTGRAGVVRPAGVVGFDATVARLIAVAKTVRESSSLLG